MKTFEQWDIDDLEMTFGISRLNNSETLREWLQTPLEITDFERQTIIPLKEKLMLNVEEWNEDELKFKFIAPLLGLINFDVETANIHAFTQRTLSAIVKDVHLGGRVDFIVAKGKSKPLQPFFFLHEYKKERGGDNNPRAQLLAEMLAASALNTSNHALYGCYIVGRNWFFVVLEGLNYAVSDAYVATQDDILAIVSILKHTKSIILQLAKTPAPNPSKTL